MSRGDGPFRVRGGHIWPIDSVDVRPRVQLSSWRAYEVAHPRGEALSRHRSDTSWTAITARSQARSFASTPPPGAV